MITNLIKNSKLNWIKTDKLPERKGDRSVDLIMLFNDGFVSRGYYNYLEDSWYGYNTFTEIEKYFNGPDYYILL